MNSGSGLDEETANDGKPQILAAGFLLLGLGLLVLWLLSQELWAMYNDPTSNRFVVKIVKPLAGAKVMIDDHLVSINDGFALGGAIVLLIMLAGLGISMAAALLNSGAKLLAPQVQKELAKLSRRIQELQLQNRGRG